MTPITVYPMLDTLYFCRNPNIPNHPCCHGTHVFSCVKEKNDAVMAHNFYYIGMGKEGQERRLRYREFLQMEESYGSWLDKCLFTNWN